MSSPTANAWPECREERPSKVPRVTNRTSVLRRSGKFKDAHPHRVQSDDLTGPQVRRSQMSAQNGPVAEANAPYRYPTTRPTPTLRRSPSVAVAALSAMARQRLRRLQVAGAGESDQRGGQRTRTRVSLADGRSREEAWRHVVTIDMLASCAPDESGTGSRCSTSIVVGLDGSPSSTASAQYAIDPARAGGGKPHVMMVAPLVASLVTFGGASIETMSAELDKRATAGTDEAAETCPPRCDDGEGAGQWTRRP